MSVDKQFLESLDLARADTEFFKEEYYHLKMRYRNTNNENKKREMRQAFRRLQLEEMNKYHKMLEVFEDAKPKGE